MENNVMSKDKKTHICFTCEKEFQFEEHIYDGKWIQCYKIEVCMSCWNNNLDGWTPHYGKKIIKHLHNKKLTIPSMNEKGFLHRGE